MSEEKKCDHLASFVIGIFGGLLMGGGINFLFLLEKFQLIYVIIINVFISLIVNSIALFYNINYNQPYEEQSVECDKLDFSVYWFAIGFHISHLVCIFGFLIYLKYSAFPQQQGSPQLVSSEVKQGSTSGGGRRRRKYK